MAEDEHISGGLPNWVKHPIISGTGVLIFLPLDYLKTQMQLMSEGKNPVQVTPTSLIKQLILSKNISHLYKGLDAALCSHMISVGISTFLYTVLSEMTKAQREDRQLKNLDFLKLMVFSKFMGFFLQVPFELALIRMQGDHLLEERQRRNYKNVGEALRKISSEEGFVGCWRGGIASQLLKNIGYFVNGGFTFILKGEQKSCVLCSGISALITSSLVLPFDNIKTKYQFMGKSGVIYESYMDCITKTMKREGLKGFYAGFSVYALKNSIFSYTLIGLSKVLFPSN